MGGVRRGWALFFAAAAPVLGCGADTFSCAQSTQCGDGFCEQTGHCSFADDGCESGRRYGEYAGTLSDRCVPSEPMGSSGGSATSTGPSSSTSGAASTSTLGTAADSVTGDATTVSEASGDPDPFCGDGTLDRGEACDDGNEQEADGCSADCLLSGTVVWSDVRESDAAMLEQFSGVAVLGEDAVVVGQGFLEKASQDVLLQRFSPDGDTLWAVVHDVAGGEDRGAGVVVAAETLTVFGGATVGQGAGEVVERWVGQFSPDDGSVVQQTTLGEGELFGGAASVGGVVLVGTDGTGAALERAWVGSITASLTLEYAVVDDGVEASQYYGVAVRPTGETFAAGMRGANTNTVADFIVDSVTPGAVTETRRMPAEFDLSQAQGIVSSAGGDLLIGGLTLFEAGGRALYLERFSDAKGILWSVTESSADTESDEVEAVAIAPDGDVLVTGLYWGGDRRGTDVLLRRFSASGELRWSAELDVAGGRDLGRAIAVTPLGKVYVCGLVETGEGDDRAYVVRVVP